MFTSQTNGFGFGFGNVTNIVTKSNVLKSYNKAFSSIARIKKYSIHI